MDNALRPDGDEYKKLDSELSMVIKAFTIRNDEAEQSSVATTVVMLLFEKISDIFAEEISRIPSQYSEKRSAAVSTAVRLCIENLLSFIVRKIAIKDAERAMSDNNSVVKPSEN